MPRTDNLVIKQGSTWGVIIPVVDPAGDPANLAGWSVRAQVRRRVTDEAVLYAWTTALGNASIDGANVTLTVSAAESAAFDWTNAVYDVELVNGATVLRITQGAITIDREVTR